MTTTSTSLPAAAARLGHARAAAGRLVRAQPFSVCIAAAVWALGVVTGSITAGPAAAVRETVGAGAGPLAAGRWWTPATSALFASGPVGYVTITVLLLAVCGAVERRIGTIRVATLFALAQAAGALAVVGSVRLAVLTGGAWAGQLAGEVTVGAAPAIVGVAMAGAGSVSPLWRRRIRLVILVAAVTGVLYVGSFASLTVLAGALVGLAAGRLVDRRAELPARTAGRTGQDRRTLTALIVAAVAAGPAATFLTSHGSGPLAALNFLFLPRVDAADVASRCAAATGGSVACAGYPAAAMLHGVAPAMQTLLPVLLLLVLADGLRRGRRAAAFATIAVNIGLALLGAVESRRELADLVGDAAPHLPPASQLWVVKIAAILLPAAVAALVFLWRREFPVRLPWRTQRRWLAAIAITVAAVAAGYLLVGMLVRDQFLPAATPVSLATGLAARLAPAGYLTGALAPVPTGPVAAVLTAWAGPTLWAALLAATVVHFRRVRRFEHAPETGKARTILTATGGPTGLAHMTLWAGNRYCFTPDETGYVAYRVVSGVAVTTGDPIGTDPAAVIDAFLSLCRRCGYTPCFFSVTVDTADLLVPHGFGMLPVACDSTIDPAAVTFTGKHWQDIRTAVNRAHRDGTTATWGTYPTLPEDVRAQIRELDRDWLADKNLPEMGFTLGGLAELDDPDIRLLTATDTDGRVLAATSWLPGYRGGRITGWTLDYMRRGPAAPPGVMEFLIATAITTLRSEGATWISLSGVPLAFPSSDLPTGMTGHALHLAAAVMEPVYGFASLLAFKQKFAPTFTPLYLCYPDAAALPRIASAVIHAYVPHLGIRQTTSLLRQLAHRNPGARATVTQPHTPTIPATGSRNHPKDANR